MVVHMADSCMAVVLLDTDPHHAVKTLTHGDCTGPVHQGRPDRPYEPQTVREASQAGSMSEAVNDKVRPDTDDHLGSITYLKYEANNVIPLRSRVLCLHRDLQFICLSRVHFISPKS